jgi:hypothetical protein
VNQLTDSEYQQYKKMKEQNAGRPLFIAQAVTAFILFGCLWFAMQPAFWGPASAQSAQQQPVDPNPQTAYVPQPGDCVVLPQGQDAVYDLYYAEKVNPANCKAFVDQAQARVLDAQAMAIIDNEINDDNQMGLGALLGAIGAIIAIVAVLWLIASILGVR